MYIKALKVWKPDIQRTQNLKTYEGRRRRRIKREEERFSATQGLTRKQLSLYSRTDFM
jgi:hypothetical protein